MTDASIGIVIPAYRPDPERLATYVDSLQTTLQPAAIHVELDDPRHDVLSVLEETVASVHVASRRRGKGAAITAGFDHLDTDVLVFADADGSTPADSLGTVVDSVASGRAELAVGSRRHPESDVPTHQTRVRRRLGDLFVRMARLALPIRLYDYQCGAKAITSEHWASIREELVSGGFAWDLEFVALAHATGGRVEEVPITWEDRPGTTVTMLGASEFALGLWRARHGAKRVSGDRFHSAIDGIGIGRPIVAGPYRGRPVSER